MHARLTDGRWFRVLTVVDQFTRECLLLHADLSMRGVKVVVALEPVVRKRGKPQSITCDNGSEFPAKRWMLGLCNSACSSYSLLRDDRLKTAISSRSTVVYV